MPKIVYSVGKNGMNRMLDTAFIQLLINQALKTKSWHKPLVVDGKCGPNTITAITNLQSKLLQFMHADGLIEPDRTTFNGLIKLIPADDINSHWNTAVKKCQPIGIITTGGREKAKKPLPEQLVKVPDTPPSLNNYNYVFPLDFVPTHDYHKGGHARHFGAPRQKGSRLHAGCDLLAPVGSPVYAISDGVVEGNPSYFYDGTYAVTVRHGKIVVRYGELLAFNASNRESLILPNIRSMAKVSAGEVIGYVGKLASGSSMLHFEYYSGTSSGPLTNRNSASLYRRRSDLIDPTSMLDKAKNNLPKAAEYPSKSDTETAISIGLNEKRKKGF